MMSSYVKVLLCCILFSVNNQVTGERGRENSYTLRKISERLDVLTNEVKALKERFPGVTIGGDHSLTPIEVSRYVTDEGILFTVKYVTDGKSEVVALWNRADVVGGFSKVVPSKNLNISDTLRETSYITRATAGDLYLHLNTKYVSYYLGFDLHNTEQANATFPISVPKMEIMTSSDLTYAFGENTTLTIKTANMKARRPGPGRHHNRVDAHFRVYDLNKGEFINTYRDDQYIKDTTEKKFFDYTETTYTINTAENNITGMIVLIKNDMERESKNPIINFAGRSELLTLHPKSQQGPFPAGFIATIRPFGGLIEDGETEVTLCSLNEPTCSIYCSALGTDLKDLNLLEILPDGTTSVPDYAGPEIRDIPRNFEMSFQAEIRTPTKDNTRRFKCIAHNRHGQTAAHNIETISFVRAKINTEQSSLVRDGQNATLTCVAVGDPLPNIKFHLQYNYRSYRNEDPDDVVVNGNTMMATKQIVYDDGDDQGYYAQSTGKLWSADCKAEQSIPQANLDYPIQDNFHYSVE